MSIELLDCDFLIIGFCSLLVNIISSLVNIINKIREINILGIVLIILKRYSLRVEVF